MASDPTAASEDRPEYVAPARNEGRAAPGGAAAPVVEGVLIGATVLHKPRSYSQTPSRKPGFGEIVWSKCDRFQGIVYDREWTRDDTVIRPMCKWCARA